MTGLLFIVAQSSAERRGQLIGMMLAGILIFVVGFVLLRISKRKKK